MICTTKRLLIKEWIATPQDKLKELSPDDPIIETIFEFLENPDSDLELLKLIVKKLYELYQCEDGRLRLITLSLVPVLMSIYIRIAHNYYYHLPKSEFNSLTVLLIYVYNIEIIDHHSSSSLGSHSSSNHLSHSANPTPMPPPSLPPLSSTAAQPMQPPPQLIPPIQHKKSHSDNGINLIPGGGGGGTAVSPGMMAASALAAGRLKTIDIRVVSLSKPSIYHEKNSALVTAAAGTDTLTRINPNHHNQGDTKICIFGPYCEVEELVNSNYLSVFAVLLKVYNNHIAELGRCTLRALCQFYLRLFQQGQLASAAGGGDSDCGAKLASDIKEKIKQFLTTADSDPEMIQLPRNCIRIQFSSEFLVELTRSCHYCIYNDFEELGLELMDEICNYSTYKLYGEVLLLINAMKNSIAINNQRLAEMEAIRQKQRTASLIAAEQSQYQQNSAIAPLATTITSAISTISNIISSKTHPQSQALHANGVNNSAQQNGSAEFIKSPNSIMSSPIESSITSSGGGGFGVGGRPKMAITNASFKTKKLPDDIPIVIHPSSVTNSNKNSTTAGNSNKLSGNKKGAGGASKSASAAQLAQMAKKLDSIDEEKSARMAAAAANRTLSSSSSSNKNQKQPLPHHHSLLQQQNSKESSSNSSLASTTSSTAANSTAVASAAAAAAQKQQPNNKKGVMYLLKEFKRTGNNSSSSSNNNRDCSPLSIANQNGGGISIAVPNIQANIKPTTVAASTTIANGNADDDNNSNEEDDGELFIDELDSIPLKPLKLIPDKFIDDDEEDDEDNDDQDDSKEHVDVGNNNNGVNDDGDDDDDDGNYFNNGGDEDNELITEDEPGTGAGGGGNSNQSDQSTSSSKELLPTCTAGSTTSTSATIVALKKITGNNSCSGTTAAANNDSSAASSSSSPTMTSTMSPEKKAFLFSKL